MVMHGLYLFLYGFLLSLGWTAATVQCDPKTCKLPTCHCVGTDIPGDTPVKETPMMVMLTFDDGVNWSNYKYFTKLFYNRYTNPNSCPIQGTFFVSGDATNYDFVQNLYTMGQEIGSHSQSHRFPISWWKDATYQEYVKEMAGMRKTLSERSMIPIKNMKGMRAPFLQLRGDDQFEMMTDQGFTYDSSMIVGGYHKDGRPPLWPFTLDFALESCSQSECPVKPHPGLWEVPLVRWYGSDNGACSMADQCATEPGRNGTLQYLRDNFNRHYKTNRAPFGVFIHATWFTKKAGNLDGLMDFLQELSTMDDVWVISVSQMLDWIREPKNISEVKDICSWKC